MFISWIIGEKKKETDEDLILVKDGGKYRIAWDVRAEVNNSHIRCYTLKECNDIYIYMMYFELIGKNCNWYNLRIMSCAQGGCQRNYDQ